MKLSEMTTQNGFDLMEKILPDVAAIFEDEQVRAVHDGIIKENDKISVGQNLAPVMSVIIGKHRTEMLNIVAAVKGKTVEDVKAQPLGETLEDFQQCVSEDMLGFFGACLRMVMIV